MSKIFAILLLVCAVASAQYVYSGLGYTSGYASPLAYSNVGYTGYSGLGYAVPSYTGLGYGYGYASPYYGGLAYYKK